MSNVARCACEKKWQVNFFLNFPKSPGVHSRNRNLIGSEQEDIGRFYRSARIQKKIGKSQNNLTSHSNRKRAKNTATTKYHLKSTAGTVDTSGQNWARYGDFTVSQFPGSVTKSIDTVWTQKSKMGQPINAACLRKGATKEQ